MHYPTDRITHTTAFVTPVVEHWLEREIEDKRDELDAVLGLAHSLAIFVIRFRKNKCHGNLGPIS